MNSRALKLGWRSLPFGEFAESINDRVDDPRAAGVQYYVGLEHLDSDSLKIRRWGIPADVEATKLGFRAGDIIFGRRRAYQRKLAVAEFDGICSAHALVLRAKSGVVDGDFLPFLMQSDVFMERAKAISVGSLSPTINWKTLATQVFAVPPIDEQRRLAKLLCSTSACVEAFSDAVSAGQAVIKAFCRYLVESCPDDERVRVGAVSKFTSGKLVKVSDLPQQPSATSPIPVYGGNGICAYVAESMTTISEKIIVVGRVGQFCGVTRLVEGPVWVTDNALYPVQLDVGMDMSFLALCLRGANLNYGKLGEYLPLITQAVVHDARVPKPSMAMQLEWVERYKAIEVAMGAVKSRFGEARHIHASLLSSLWPPGET